MAEKQRFPQMPTTVWWGVRSMLQKSPRAVVDERMLGVQLGVQEAAARQYIVELTSVGILDDECRATELASRWRLNESYPSAVKEIIENNYPDGLVHVAPPSAGDRQKIVSWFEREGLGRGAAGNKAATYLLLGSLEPSDSPGKANGKGAKTKASTKGQVVATPSSSSERSTKAKTSKPIPQVGQLSKTNSMPLNVNVQIHISADAGVEQIDAIFSSMRRYLADGTDA